MNYIGFSLRNLFSDSINRSLFKGTVGRSGGAEGTGEDEGDRICCWSNRLVSDA